MLQIILACNTISSNQIILLILYVAIIRISFGFREYTCVCFPYSYFNICLEIEDNINCVYIHTPDLCWSREPFLPETSLVCGIEMSVWFSDICHVLLKFAWCLRGCNTVATGQEKVREKINFSRSGKSQGIFILFRENWTLEKSQRQVTLVREN